MSLGGELLSTLRDPRMLHAAVVHLPVALSLVGLPLVASLLWTAGRSRNARRATLSLYVCLAGCALLAVATGGDALARAGAVPAEGRELLSRHEWLARRVWLTALAVAASAAASGARSRVVSRVARVSCAGAAILCAAWVGLVGHTGGTAVYGHGVGIELTRSEAASADPRAEHFVERVLPVLERSCSGCHGPGEHASGGLDLGGPAGLLRGGSRGPAIVPGNARASLLYRAVSGDLPDLRMPLAGPRLTPTEVEALSDWIDDGAIWPGSPDP